jgi:hypothetical protein
VNGIQKGDVFLIHQNKKKGADKWNELLDFLAELGNSQREDQRLQSMTIFSNLLQNLAEDLEVFYDQFANIFRRGLVDTSIEVRITALTGASHLLSYEVSYTTQFQEFLPQIMEVLILSLRNNSNMNCPLTLKHQDNHCSSR